VVALWGSPAAASQLGAIETSLAASVKSVGLTNLLRRLAWLGLILASIQLIVASMTGANYRGPISRPTRAIKPIPRYL
jgi:hypothetical protein